MPRRLIVNADDFGLTRGVNHAVAELHDAGALTSATLMASGAAFQNAIEIAKARPHLGVGCHVVLTDGRPTSPAKAIPTLLARNGNALRPSLVSFLLALHTNQIDAEDIEREAVAQIRSLQHAGITVTHLDTHKHTHLFPFVLKPLLRAAERTGVRSIRNPFEQPWAFRLSNGSAARTSQVRALQPLKRALLRQPTIRAGQIRTTDGTVGVSATGSLDGTTLRNLVDAVPEGTWELVCHPGYNDRELLQVTTRLRHSREVEREALLETLGRPPENNSQNKAHQPPLELIHYGEL